MQPHVFVVMPFGIKEAQAATPAAEGKPGNPAVTVNFDEVRVRIADEGLGFDPSAVPDPTLPENRERPSGRGIMLMRYYMSAVEYNERGNCIQICKRKVNHPCGS